MMAKSNEVDKKTPKQKKVRGGARFEIENETNSLTIRERRRLFNPWADFVWRNGRMFVRQSPAERAARRRRGKIDDLAFDAWTALHLGDAAPADWFLTDYLRLYPNMNRTLQELREALLHILGTQWADRPAQDVWKNPPPWLDPTSKNPKGYLYKAVKKEAERRHQQRAKASRLWERLDQTPHLGLDLEQLEEGEDEPIMRYWVENEDQIETLIESTQDKNPVMRNLASETLRGLPKGAEPVDVKKAAGAEWWQYQEFQRKTRLRLERRRKKFS